MPSDEKRVIRWTDPIWVSTGGEGFRRKGERRWVKMQVHPSGVGPIEPWMVDYLQSAVVPEYVGGEVAIQRIAAALREILGDET